MIIKNIFTEKELEIINNDLTKCLSDKDWKNWNDLKFFTWDISKYPKEQGDIMIKKVSPHIKNIISIKLWQIDPFIRSYEFEAHYQIWEEGSGTGIHNDSAYMFNATFYLNKNWNADAGGLYVYRDVDEYKVYVPTYNTCMYNNQNSIQDHLVTPVTRYAQEKRYTIHCKGMIVKNEN